MNRMMAVIGSVLNQLIGQPKNFNLNMRLKFSIIIFFASIQLMAQSPAMKEVNLSGNAYVTEQKTGAEITQNGLENWTDKYSRIKTYIFFSRPQKIRLKINGTLSRGISTIRVSVNNHCQTVKLNSAKFSVALKPIDIQSAGYTAITLQGISRTGKEFASIESFSIESDDEQMVYVHDFSDYFARRGPSVHLFYTMPKDTIEWFYNEITVPKGNDVIGSFYMANGFGEGYFGMQCNSETERKVLFSVWSPFETQDPKLIPANMKVRLIKKGEGVYIGEFGNEGAGARSFLEYPWKAGNTYRFLTHIAPDGAGNTIYTSWFFAPENNSWKLVASFLRPQTNTYYTSPYSFLENFIPEQGYINSKVFFGNQWFYTTSGKWIPATEATFSYDDTAMQKMRVDYQGGYDRPSNRFFLRHNGFFYGPTKFNSVFRKMESVKSPEIAFEILP